jgi:hypothetical protein
MTHRILRPLPSTVYTSGQKAHPAIVHRPLSTVYPAVCRPRSAVCIRLFVLLFVDGLHHRQAGKPALLPSAVRGLRSTFQAGKPTLRPSTVHSAVCRPRSAVCIRLFVPHSLTVCIPGRLENLPYGGPPSAVCGLHFRLGSPPCDCPTSIVHRPFRGLPSAVRRLYLFIRSPFVDGLHPRQAGKPALLPSAVCGLHFRLGSPPCDCPPSIPRSAVCGPPSVFVYSFSIR